MRRRWLTSTRVLGGTAAAALVLLVMLAQILQQQERERSLQELVSVAELVAELALEAQLPATPAHRLGAASSRVIDRSIQHLMDEGQLVGLQLWDADEHLLYSDAAHTEALSTAEVRAVPAVLAGQPHVELEHDHGRDTPTASVLIQPENVQDQPSGVVAEILLPRGDLDDELAALTRKIYAAGGALLLALVAVLVSLRSRMRRREHEATHDALTSLGNRAQLHLLAPELLRERHERPERGFVALLLLDLDGFKTVNDTLGHAVGDLLLSQVAATLRRAVRPHDVVTRLGGDEFALLLSDLPETDVAVRVAEHVCSALHRPFVVNNVSLEVGGSIGVAVAPQHGEELNLLLRCADVAMYQAKRAGGGVVLYDEAADPHDAAQLGLLSQLRGAIDGGELRLHYQPRVAMREGTTVGFEALVRWQHPEHGLLPPGAFVPLAERTALMRPLTAWVLREAARQCAVWRADGWGVSVAVNIPPAALLDPDLAAQVIAVLADADLPGEALELEITETAVMVDPAKAGATLRLLRAVGIGVAIDDFGAGYTSLAYLKTLPVRSLKIDRGFVTNLVDNREDEAVARSVVSLGHDLGLTVVAEGVETRDVQQRLLELGCDEAQGFLLSRPLPPDAVQSWLLGNAGRLAATAPANDE